jgi:hypothetical protein
VHPWYRDGKSLVGEPVHKAGRCRGARRRAERFDEKNLEEVGEDDLARRTPLAELVSHELHEGGEPLLAAHMDKMGKQRHQQARIGGAEAAVAHQHRDWCKTGGQAAAPVGGIESLAGWNFCPNSAPSVPL